MVHIIFDKYSNLSISSQRKCAQINCADTIDRANSDEAEKVFRLRFARKEEHIFFVDAENRSFLLIELADFHAANIDFALRARAKSAR